MHPEDITLAPFLGMGTSIGGKVVGQYRIGRTISAGGMGLLYEAVDTTLERKVIVKSLQPLEVGDPVSRQRLREEAKLASSLEHPNIVRVYEFIERTYLDLLVMEYIWGRDLGRMLKRVGAPLPKAMNYAVQTASAVAYVHSRGVVHRDLKPSNVMVDFADRVRLIDFGVSMKCGQEDPYLRTAGSKMWLAPEEQIERPAFADPRSEIFSFGLLLHMMLTGRHAFGDGAPEEIADAIRRGRPARLASQTPKVLATILMHCLETDPARRFDSMASILEALRDYAASSGIRGLSPA